MKPFLRTFASPIIITISVDDIQHFLSLSYMNLQSSSRRNVLGNGGQRYCDSINANGFDWIATRSDTMDLSEFLHYQLFHINQMLEKRKRKRSSLKLCPSSFSNFGFDFGWLVLCNWVSVQSTVGLLAPPDVPDVILNVYPKPCILINESIASTVPNKQNEQIPNLRAIKFTVPMKLCRYG